MEVSGEVCNSIAVKKQVNVRMYMKYIMKSAPMGWNSYDILKDIVPPHGVRLFALE